MRASGSRYELAMFVDLTYAGMAAKRIAEGF